MKFIRLPILAASFAALVASALAEDATFRGSVVSVDTSANTLTVSNKKDGSKTFKSSPSTSVSTKAGGAAKLADVVKGAKVRVITAEKSDVATKIVILPAKEKDSK